ncbi:MAG: Phosphoenolpyruvate synthase [Candidatus Magasanikbacteria bacterium GW2011_GWC2_40_17]|uniref:Phosphoenolpyruvate synthase n=1 Tax=Candidatus Magasanikbacteria bacterium GW2011_GWA2_42_32 TaxID=1619039 RepID=A0A0G1A743_9BACT|nr:MAG: Phosphoenolpyruvate synthase [Candidatus Magasanikbacteria bacterium GW2011_GWC2_40_17]KKS56867.1 MAG: Phosphoenolpyruvate synthase [Candidatus Magasanikbacteria bacterium GW2011_GWA2_42_32]OGH85651.1 MAG: phosphoenolpyruvate synthase [Candidatus Magasanikbacteria bacterium RIFOXYB2_FULL_38_10]
MYIKWFKEISIKDIPLVGGKNASLGEMYSNLTQKGINIPNGFAVTAESFRYFLKYNKLDDKIKEILKDKKIAEDVKKLSAAGKKIRELMLLAKMPRDLVADILKAYKELGKNVDVAVRSSATAEDLPQASFAGQQESYLNVSGEKALLEAIQKCYASLFTDRAISYRNEQGFDHEVVALSAGVQKMVRSDLACSGVMFTLDTESGFRDVVLINGSWGLGENIVKGRVNPDQFIVFKKTLEEGYKSIISRNLGSKEMKLLYAGTNRTLQKKVTAREQHSFVLNDEEILQLAKWGMEIERYYGRPQDIEWAKDGRTKKLFIVQARPETIHALKNTNVIEDYRLEKRGKILTEGLAVGEKIGQGKAHIIQLPKELKYFKKGEVLVTRITDPDWEPIMRMASAIVTEQGGKTSHAAIVSRELGVPCVVGTGNARKTIKNGLNVTVSCAEGERGFIYEGLLSFKIKKEEIKEMTRPQTKIMMNVGTPDEAFKFSFLPNDGVGLAREEFIFTNFIKIHPEALINYDKQPRDVKEKINHLTVGYKEKKHYLIDKLAEGVALLAAAFYPKDVIVRFSDFKTNEYASLIGGKDFEPKEENPMIGWRGASRYYDKNFENAFGLECAAMKKAREVWGLKNIIVMIPFCRTVEEGKKVLATMEKFGLKRGENGLKVYMMVEIPANIILADQFAKIFDGFSIGSNDLTQLTLGVDRDSALVSHIYNERNEAVTTLIKQVIKVAKENNVKIGICGQAPSDYPEFAEFLVKAGIDSISLNPDTVVATTKIIVEMEKKIGK